MSTESFILSFQEIDRSTLTMAGGKGANLGELSRIKGIHVPNGFCITTEAYKRIFEGNPLVKKLLSTLSLLKIEDRDAVRKLSAEIRTAIETTVIPENIKEEIISSLHGKDDNAYAVRSSATAEDLPTASFAGQQDTYLNVIGKDSILKHISKCWASLFTERAIIYRIQNGFEHDKVHLSVIVQEMVFPEVSGIMFTADPVNGNRKVLSIDASFGLGDALVSGLVNADTYKVRDGKIIDKRISDKKSATYSLKDGGTKVQEIEHEMQSEQTLSDEQILQLERIGRKIETHFCCPQDIEWCLADSTFYIVQSRPITTLYPIPEADDNENHVYISVGHQQMMTDAMKPLGLSLWQLTASRPMYKAGGRLFVDVAPNLASVAGRKTIIDVMEQHDPLIKDALITITERGDFIKLLSNGKEDPASVKSSLGKSSADILTQIENDPAIVSSLIKHSEALVAELKHSIQMKSGLELFDFILEDLRQLKKSFIDSQNRNAIMAAIDASTWINENINTWLDEKNVTDTLSQSVPNNITSKMGLELLNIADLIRPYPKVVAYLQHVKDDNFLDELLAFEGGQEIRDAIHAYLDKYGMRGAGEIDITRVRWSEKPLTLVPVLLSNIKNLGAGAGKLKFEQGRQEAFKKEYELIEKLKQLPDGEQKAREAKEMISLLRNFSGYREYPKYSIVNHLFIYKKALLKETEKLVKANVIREKEDVYYLTFEEFHEVVRTNKIDYQIISKRKEEHKQNEKLNPPRVITSDGEIVRGHYKQETIPTNAIAGLAVSSGIMEGRARIILNIEDADIEDGDILVTPFTDPSWTPLFVSIKGLITEVGGLMTHGAVIAREYGLPAVVGVEDATKRIKDGQRIRVNGTDGYIELL